MSIWSLLAPIHFILKGVVGDPIGSIFKSHMGYWEPLVGLLVGCLYEAP